MTEPQVATKYDQGIAGLGSRAFTEGNITQMRPLSDAEWYVAYHKPVDALLRAQGCRLQRGFHRMCRIY